MTTSNSPEATPFITTQMGLDQVQAAVRERLERLERLPGNPDQIAEFLDEHTYTGQIKRHSRPNPQAARRLAETYRPFNNTDAKFLGGLK